MSPDSNLRAGTVSHRSLAILKEHLRNVAEYVSSSERGDPVLLVHGELFEVFHIDNDVVVDSVAGCYRLVSQTEHSHQFLSTTVR